MGSRVRVLAAAAVLAVMCASTAAADPLGRTTTEETIAGGERPAFSFLRTGPGEPYVVREDIGAKAAAGRQARRRSLAYFAQLTDFQLADEESPARVESTDDFNSFFYAAWRPQEALLPHMVDAHIRQVNALSRSPLRARGGRAKLGFAILTGDNADNQQLNETDWVATLLRGGRIDPNSGSSDPADHAACPPGTPGPDEARRYTGFQDYDDYVENGAYYDPDRPAGLYASWPSWPGLMDRAQEPFEAAGLDVPAYVAFGNHDALVQGNEDANSEFERVAVGCTKAMQGSTADGIDTILPYMLQTDPAKVMNVPPDPRRRFVSKAEYKERFKGVSSGFGFDFVDPAEQQASAGAAGYYDFSPSPGLRFIALDTVSEGGVVGCSSDGNLDDPQLKWLERRLQAAKDADELVVLYGHHSIQSLTCPAPDEVASPCTGADSHGHDVNPGCDADPRSSEPIHDGADLTELLTRFPHAIAFVAGHSHVNDVVGFKTFWNVRTSAEADWPHQQRLIELMDNGDGTLSIFGTLIDSAAPVAAPAAGTPAAGMSVDQLASIGRTLGYNDPQGGGGTGEGDAKSDRNVELLIADPRRAPGAAGTEAASPARRLRVRARPSALRAGRRTRVAFRVTAGGRPVRRARVTVAGRRARTGREGVARVVVKARRRGVLTVRVTSPGLRPAALRLRVRR